MAFIRPLSNPEGLYVYHNIHGYISWNRTIQLPIRDFYMLARMCEKSWDQVGKWGRLELREVRVDSKDKILTSKAVDKLYSTLPRTFIAYKKALYFDGKLISLMWDVTWESLHNSIMRGLNFDKKKKTANKSRGKKKNKVKTG